MGRFLEQLWIFEMQNDISIESYQFITSFNRCLIVRCSPYEVSSFASQRKKPQICIYGSVVEYFLARRKGVFFLDHENLWKGIRLEVGTFLFEWFLRKTLFSMFEVKLKSDYSIDLLRAKKRLTALSTFEFFKSSLFFFQKQKK